MKRRENYIDRCLVRLRVSLLRILLQSPHEFSTTLKGNLRLFSTLLYTMPGGNLRNLKPTTKDCKDLIPALLSYLESFEERFQSHVNEIKEEFKTQITLRDVKIASLETEVEFLKKKFKKMESLVDDADAYERRDTVIFSGPAIPECNIRENCSEIIQGILKNEMKINVSNHDISTVHRLGPKPRTQGPDKRVIVAKFCRRDLKGEILTASRRQNKPARIYANESLTPPRLKIYNTLRQMKREHPELVCGVSSYDGRVFAYTRNPVGPTSQNLSRQGAAANTSRPRDRRHLVNTYDMLVDFCRDFVQKPIDTFLDSWPY